MTTPTGAQRDFGRWTESHWTAPDLDGQGGAALGVGVDVGSASTQAVVLVDGELLGYADQRGGASRPGSARDAVDAALKGTDLALDDVHGVVATGCGRSFVPFAHRAVTEVLCHARGAAFLCGPDVHTVLDLGAQDTKVIRCDERGRVADFLLNDKCDAGSGRGMEVFADLLSVPIGELGETSLDVAREPEPIFATCVVFAKTEAARLLRGDWSKEEVLAAYCSSVAHRASRLLERVGVEPDLAVTGGVATNRGVVERIERELGVKAREPRHLPQLAGALGAALFAMDLVEEQREARGG